METKEKNSLRPWLRPDGSKRSDAEISKLGKSWDAKTWKRFLDEDVGKITDDGRITYFKKWEKIPGIEEKLADAQTSNRVANLNLRVIFEMAFEELSYREQLVLEKFFWDGISLRKIAEEVRSSPSAVHMAKQRALTKLKKILSSSRFGQKLSTNLRRLAATRPKRCSILNRPKRVQSGTNPSLKHETLDFIEDNLTRLTHLERKVVEFLYFREMDLKSIASILKKTVGEVKELRASAYGKLERIYHDGFIENKKLQQKAG